MENNLSLSIFNSNDFGDVRYVTIDNEPWFAASDICKLLKIQNSRNAVSLLYPEERDVHVMDTPGGEQKLTIISESGLYHLIFNARPKRAKGLSKEEVAEREEQLKKFRLWVTDQVLPSIRKHGAYVTPKTTIDLVNNPQLLIDIGQKIIEEQKKREEAEQRNVELASQNTALIESKGKLEDLVIKKDRQLIEAIPKARRYDKVINSSELLTISEIAQDFRLTGQELNKMLADAGVQYKIGRNWYLKKPYTTYGYVQLKTYVDPNGYAYTHRYWTHQGRIFIYEFLQERGIPLTVELLNEQEEDPSVDYEMYEDDYYEE